ISVLLCCAMFGREMMILTIRKARRIQRLILLVLFSLALSRSSIGIAVAQRADPDKLPMYGQPAIARPENLKKADESFVRDSMRRFGTRDAASRAMVAQGWDAVRSRNFDQAMQ